MLRDLKDFLQSRVFLINLAAMILVLFGIIFGVRAYLDHYTLHGESITIPDVKGESFEEASRILDKRGLNTVLQDSVHADEAEPGEVLEQDPEAKKKVKKGRNIYITIVAEGHQMVSVPDLEDRSRRHALSLLKTLGLTVKEYEFEADICEDCVLEQRYKGEPVEAGERIPKGSGLTLVLGKGRGEEGTHVPELLGLTIKEARERLLDRTLKLGRVDYDEGCCPTSSDSMNARIYGQEPSASGNRTIQEGSKVEVQVTTDTSKVRSSKRDSTEEGSP